MLNAGAVNEGKVTLLVGCTWPKAKVGAAAFTSSFFDIGVISDAVGLVINGDVNDVAPAENEKPPRRGTVSFDEVVTLETVLCVTGKLNVTVFEGDNAVAIESLICGVSFFKMPGVVTTSLKDGGADVVRAILGELIDCVVVATSLELLSKTFSGSIGLVLIASDGAFNTDVVVAVLNVTEVFVVKLADSGETATFASSFSIGFSTALLLTLSTSSFDSSPRKKLNIISNFDF